MELSKLIPLCALLLLLLPPSPVSSDGNYSIDCGSSSKITFDERVFTGDAGGAKTAGVDLLTKHSKVVTDSSNSNASIYITARVFNYNAAYQFEITQMGTYILRLYFYAFSSSEFNLTTALFNVSANDRLLLHNFSGRESSVTPVMKEFLLPVNSSKLKIFFVPIESSFVNAIEVVFAPVNLTDDASVPVVTTSGENGVFRDMGSTVFRSIYRINVGGSNVSSSADLLHRNWSQDDPYLLSGTSNTTDAGPKTVDYESGNATKYDAPDEVYKTARELNPNPNQSSNATWRFNVSRSSTYFVRVHLCDIVSTANQAINFSLYVYTKFVKTCVFNMAAPYFLDFVVKSDDTGFMNISIGSRTIDSIENSAYLNGLEIMEVINGSAAEPNVPTSTSHVALIAGVVSAGIALILSLVGAFLWFYPRNRKKAEPVESFDWPIAALYRGGSSASKITSDKTVSGSCTSISSLHLRIPFSEIQQVTNNFDESLVIGQGGFGKVYKGAVKGQKVAVKRSDSMHGQGLPEFQTEITVLSKIRHRHLVSLVGYCDESSEMILVYEFMENGTLRDHLYDNPRIRGEGSKRRTGMPWKQRLEICIGAAKGLHYLHTGSTGGIIHRDVKSTNILLDENCMAKVADFGLSRPGALDQQTHVTTFVKGTFGYLDPEYSQCGLLTEKSDVYSFGVLLLEVLCARLPLDPSLEMDQVNLVDWVMACKARGELDLIIDPLLVGQIDPNSLKRFVETAEKCVRQSSTDRPAMSDVVWDLEYALQLQKTGGQQGASGDSTSTTDMSLNLPKLAISYNLSSTSFAIEEESGAIDDVSGLCTDSAVSIGQLKVEDSI